MTIKDGRLYMFVHYNEQLLRNMRYIYKIRHFSGISRNASNNQIVLDLNYIRVVKNREDARETCNSTLLNDDQEWLKHVIEHIGCIPTYWMSFGIENKYPVCNTQFQLQNMSKYLAFKNAHGRNIIFNKYTQPCQGTRVSANSNKDRYKKDDILKIKFRFRYDNRKSDKLLLNCGSIQSSLSYFLVLTVMMKQRMLEALVTMPCGEALVGMLEWF